MSSVKTFKFKNGNTYTGEALNGKMHGKGTLNLEDGRIATGTFKEGRLHGIITIKTTSDITYSSEYNNGKRVKEEENKDDENQLKTFFISSIFDPKNTKDDMVTMQHPMFTLSTKKDTRIIKYETTSKNEKKIVYIKPSVDGLPTIFDKDILIFCLSILTQEKNKGKKISKTIRLTAHELLVATGRATGGSNYKQLKQSLDRLHGVSIKTDVETNKTRIAKAFHVLDSWEIIENKNERMDKIEITVSDWFFNSVIGSQILSINPKYYELRKPLEKRLYEIARKFCGKQIKFSIGFEKLFELSGSTDASKRSFKQKLLRLINNSELPDYYIYFDKEKSQITFFNKNNNKAIDGIRGKTLDNLKQMVKDSKTGWDFTVLLSEFNLFCEQKGEPENFYGALTEFVKKKIKKAP